MPSAVSSKMLVSLVALVLQGTPISAQRDTLFPRDYLADVCKPAVEAPSTVIPPCTEIETIESTCWPNGTEPLALIAHQECMCGGSYFPDWLACLDCQYFHGVRSPRDYIYYQSILGLASSSFCGAATPAAVWQTAFAKQDAEGTRPTTGATVGSDRAPSDTAVSLYYTPSVSQGPGAITGSATAATAKASATSPSGTSASETGSKSSGSSGGSQTTSASPSTTTKPNAAGRSRVQTGSLLAVAVLVGSKLLL